MDRRPDLGWMRTFVEAVRRGSISSAAAALGMTQPAVSQQIRRLEDQVGASVLRRQRKGVEPTQVGLRLFEIADRAVSEIDALMRERRLAGASPAICLRTDYAFSALWLIPRLHAFRELHANLEIQTVATQRFFSEEMEDGDVAVVFGSPGDFGTDIPRLLPEEVVPVCSKSFLKELGPFSTVTALLDQQLIHLDAERSAPWLDWGKYGAAFESGRRKTSTEGDLRFNTYSLVVQAAVESEGIALGWRGLVDSYLRSGVLVEAGPSLATECGYWLVSPRKKNPSNARLVSWLASLVP